MANLADILGTVAGIALSRMPLPRMPTFCMLSAGGGGGSRVGVEGGGMRRGTAREGRAVGHLVTRALGSLVKQCGPVRRRTGAKAARSAGAAAVTVQQ